MNLIKPHELKTWPEYFEAIHRGSKTFEARVNDRNFAVGDRLDLREFDPKVQLYTGRRELVEVTYLMDNPAFCAPGVVIMAFRRIMSGGDGTPYRAADWPGQELPMEPA